MGAVDISYNNQDGYKKNTYNLYMTQFVIYSQDHMQYYTIKNVSETLQNRLKDICINGYIFLIDRVFEELNTNILTPQDIKRYIVNNYRAGNYDARTSKLIAQYFRGYARFDAENKRFNIYYKPTHVGINMREVRAKELTEFGDDMWML